MNTKLKDFLRYWFTTLVALMGLICLFDASVDPYRVFNAPLLPGFNARKTEIFHQEWMSKTYEASRVQPKTVLLGSSRVEIGLRASGSAWPGNLRPVYNFGIGAETPYASFRLLQNLILTRSPETVILGLDFEYFLNVYESQHDYMGDFESRLGTHADGTLNRNSVNQHALDFTNASLSLDSLTDSVQTLFGNLSGQAPDSLLGDYPNEFLFEEYAAGTFPFMEHYDMKNVLRLSGERNQYALADLRSILDLCRSHRISAILYIHPMPADTLEMIDLLGYWSAFENWKRDLVELVSGYSKESRANPIVLWDFTDYDEYSTEPVRRDGRFLHWFWESWHYTNFYGDLIIQRLLGNRNIPTGVQLSEDGLESHLRNIRDSQRQFRSTHHVDAERVRTIRDAAMPLLKARLRWRQEAQG